MLSTLLRSFAWPGAARSRVGPPQVTSTAFAVPKGALDFWLARLKEYGVAGEAPAERLGERFVHFTDPDGIGLDIVATAEPGGQPWSAGPIPVAHAIRGFHGVTISEEGYESTAKVLTEVMGFKAQGSEGNRFRYRAGSGGAFASTVDLLCVPGERQGGMGAGVVHHVAFRTPDDAQQQSWRTAIVRRGLNVSPVMDRNYLHSIYYREPGGVLFEIATDNPGFAVDEPVERLGTGLMLPTPLERYRAEIEKAVPPLRLPGAAIRDFGDPSQPKVEEAEAAGLDKPRGAE